MATAGRLPPRPAKRSVLRVLPSDAFKTITIESDAAQTITSITYTKADDALYPTDSLYYKLAIRARLPAAPFTTLYFPVIQICKSADGGTTNARGRGCRRS
jgi:hypothetical protein